MTAVAGTASTRVSDLRRRAIGVMEEDEEEDRGERRGDTSAAIGGDEEAAPLVRPVALAAAAVLRRLNGAAAAEASDEARCCCALEEDAMPASIATIDLRVESRERGQVSFFFREGGKRVKEGEGARGEQSLSERNF